MDGGHYLASHEARATIEAPKKVAGSRLHPYTPTKPVTRVPYISLVALHPSQCIAPLKVITFLNHCQLLIINREVYLALLSISWRKLHTRYLQEQIAHLQASRL